MALHRGMDGSDPAGSERVGRLGGTQEERRVDRSAVLATGTLACPACDAPVAPPGRALAPADGLICPFCHHGARTREFLSLEAPARPARVDVRVVPRLR